jgi:predicted TIM-barrel fold metal-dependent hydrolase
MTELGFAAFDVDNHYYEAEDAFTRHIDPAMRRRAMQWAEIEGRKRLLVGGRVNRFIPNPTFDPVARPGCLDEYFRARQSAQDIREAFGALEPINPAYRNRDARLALMDEQGLAATFMFPTLGVGMEAALEDDREAMLAAFRAFNRWLEDDWGLNHQGRIFTAPYITLADVDWALEELEWALAHEARVVVMRASSVAAEVGRRSLGHPEHDPFWQRLHDAGITVAIHSGDAGYGFMLDYWGQDAEFEAFRYAPLKSLLTYSPISDAVASLIAEGVFARFPNLRLATIESGSEWVGPLFKKLRKAYGQHAYAFAEDPIETFRRHVWVSPYYEDDLLGLRDMIGADHMLFGSDYPHAEGLADPVSFVHDLAGFTDEEIRLIMRDNGFALATPHPAVVASAPC